MLPHTVIHAPQRHKCGPAELSIIRCNHPYVLVILWAPLNAELGSKPKSISFEETLCRKTSGCKCVFIFNGMVAILALNNENRSSILQVDSSESSTRILATDHDQFIAQTRHTPTSRCSPVIRFVCNGALIVRLLRIKSSPSLGSEQNFCQSGSRAHRVWLNSSIELSRHSNSLASRVRYSFSAPPLSKNCCATFCAFQRTLCGTELSGNVDGVKCILDAASRSKVPYITNLCIRIGLEYW